MKIALVFLLRNEMDMKSGRNYWNGMDLMEIFIRQIMMRKLDQLTKQHLFWLKDNCSVTKRMLENGVL